MMKKIVFLSAIVITVWGCSKKMAPATSSNATVTTVVAESKPSAEMAAAGEITYTAKCGKCHKLPVTADFTSEKWASLVNWMAPKARLTDDEKKNVLAYVQSNAKAS